MTHSYIVAIDQDTHSTRPIIYDKDGTAIFIEEMRKYGVRSNMPIVSSGLTVD